MNGSTINLVGNLTRDPEVRYTTGGSAVVTTGVAVSRRYQSQGEWKEETSFFDLVIWGQLGEHAAGCLVKGTRVIASGRLEQRTWETQEGDKRSKVEIVVEAIGPELRFSTVEIIRARRDDEPKREPQRPAYTPPSYDEEPF